MIFDPRNILMFGANALLLFLFLMVNSALAGWSLRTSSRPNAGVSCALSTPSCGDALFVRDGSVD